MRRPRVLFSCLVALGLAGCGDGPAPEPGGIEPAKQAEYDAAKPGGSQEATKGGASTQAQGTQYSDSQPQY